MCCSRSEGALWERHRREDRNLGRVQTQAVLRRETAGARQRKNRLRAEVPPDPALQSSKHRTQFRPAVGLWMVIPPSRRPKVGQIQLQVLVGVAIAENLKAVRAEFSTSIRNLIVAHQKGWG